LHGLEIFIYFPLRGETGLLHYSCTKQQRLSPKQKRVGVCRSNHLHLALRLRMTGVVPPLFLYDLMLCTEAVYLIFLSEDIDKLLSLPVQI